jgi:hypothetical protein
VIVQTLIFVTPTPTPKSHLNLNLKLGARCCYDGDSPTFVLLTTITSSNCLIQCPSPYSKTTTVSLSSFSFRKTCIRKFKPSYAKQLLSVTVFSFSTASLIPCFTSPLVVVSNQRYRDKDTFSFSQGRQRKSVFVYAGLVLTDLTDTLFLILTSRHVKLLGCSSSRSLLKMVCPLACIFIQVSPMSTLEVPSASESWCVYQSD